MGRAYCDPSRCLRAAKGIGLRGHVSVWSGRRRAGFADRHRQSPQPWVEFRPTVGQPLAARGPMEELFMREPQSANDREHSRLYMAAMAMIGMGLSSIEFISGTMIPITMRHFFDSRFMISIIIDLNRLFGFVVQPYVATRGDTVRTRFGRRRPFFFLGFPVTVLFMLLIGLSPRIFAHPLSALSLIVLVKLFILNVVMQAFQDVSCGTEGPLYAETFPQKILGHASSFRPIAANLVQLVMLLGAMRLADKDEFYPYVCSAALATVAFLVIVFIIREKSEAAPAGKQEAPYSILKHARMLIDNMDYLKVAIVGAVGLAMPAAFGLFLSLFGKETLHLTPKQYGQSIWVGPALALFAAVPAGLLVDRVGAKYVMAAGFFTQMIAAIAIVFFVHDARGLMIVSGINTFGGLLHGVAITPLVFLFAKEGERGKVFGLIQFVRAAAAFVISPLIGLIADATKGYRAGYGICVALAVIGIIAALATRNVGNQEQGARQARG